MTWLEDQFEFDYCEECGGDAEHHEEIEFLGHPFALCLFPPDDDGNPHPVIQKHIQERERTY